MIAPTAFDSSRRPLSEARRSRRPFPGPRHRVRIVPHGRAHTASHCGDPLRADSGVDEVEIGIQRSVLLRVGRSVVVRCVRDAGPGHHVFPCDSAAIEIDELGVLDGARLARELCHVRERRETARHRIETEREVGSDLQRRSRSLAGRHGPLAAVRESECERGEALPGRDRYEPVLTVCDRDVGLVSLVADLRLHVNCPRLDLDPLLRSWPGRASEMVLVPTSTVAAPLPARNVSAGFAGAALTVGFRQAGTVTSARRRRRIKREG